MLAALRSKLPGAKPAAGEGSGGPFRLEVRRDGELLFEDRFEPGEVVIGSSPVADVIVADLEDEEAVILRLEVLGVAGLISLTPLVPGVEARGREQEPDRPLAFPERAAFSVEAFEFTVAHDAPRARMAAPGSLPVLLFAGAALAGLAALISGRAGGSPPAEARTPPAVEAPAPPGSAPAPGPRAADAETELRLRLVAANLMPPVRVASRSGRLVLSGVVNADERARVLDLLAAARSRLRVPIELELTSDVDVLSFVVSVSLAPDAYIIGRDNKRYEAGQRLPDGGILEAVDETSLVIDRDGIKERVTFSR